MLEEDDQTQKKVEIFEAAAFNENNEFKQRNNRWRFDKQEKMELLLSTKYDWKWKLEINEESCEPRIKGFTHELKNMFKKEMQIESMTG